MATVHIRDIMKWLVDRGEVDAHPWSSEYFLEIRFDEGSNPTIVDSDMANSVITADAAQGVVTITFDEFGRLRSLDIS